MTRDAALDVFYPIVPDIDWIGRLLPIGIKTVQLRLKDATPRDIRRQIATAIELCDEYKCQLIVNDYWEVAIDLGANYIHLGQEDLAAADLKTIKRAGLRLGISTHDEAELETALEAEPDYIALGPIYETKLKQMKWAPQGLERIKDWKAKIGKLPLVAIGGLTPERAEGVLSAGADSLSVITDFVTHAEPETRVRTWVEITQGNRVS
ncbi:MAG: thiamine phosphate synthase [Filomicrobium sp.]